MQYFKHKGQSDSGVGRRGGVTIGAHSTTYSTPEGYLRIETTDYDKVNKSHVMTLKAPSSASHYDRKEFDAWKVAIEEHIAYSKLLNQNS